MKRTIKEIKTKIDSRYLGSGPNFPTDQLCDLGQVTASIIFVSLNEELGL